MEKKTSSATGTRPKQTSRNSKGVVPRGQDDLSKQLARTQLSVGKFDDTPIVSRYTKRVIKPAQNYDVISMAKAMNEDFPAQVKELFDTETAAAERAIETGLYIAWRCGDVKFDCQRVGYSSRCFCDHSLAEHDKFDVRSVHVPCKAPSCRCKSYAWIPNRPEDIGEFWLKKRPGFDAASWRAKCKCKHTHNFHDANRPHRCKSKGCPCSGFYSDFLCAACDKHWEEHQTVFESEQERRQNGLPVGADWIPFAEVPELFDMVASEEMKGRMIGYGEKTGQKSIEYYKQ